MALLPREDLKNLVENAQDPSVSIFAPMVQAGPDTRQNPVWLKNLLRQAEDRLIELGMHGQEPHQFLQLAWNLVEDAAFWQQQAAGLAIFRNPNLFKAYRLPLEFEPVVVIGSTFHIKPLLPLMTNDGKFYILAVSENGVHLYSATRHSIAEVRIEGLPKNLADVLKYDVFEPSLQFHSAAGAGGGTVGLFHGNGEPKELEKEHLERYFRQIDRALHEVLRTERAPLVLAAVRYFLPIYQQVNTYPNLMSDIVEGNPDRPHKSLSELHQEAWKVVEPVFRRNEREAADLCRMAINQGKGSKDVAEVIQAAHHARVDRLFVPIGVQLWGSFNPADGSVRTNPTRSPMTGEDDLLNLAAFQTYLKGGTVFAVHPADMPVNSSVAATFRF